MLRDAVARKSEALVPFGSCSPWRSCQKLASKIYPALPAISLSSCRICLPHSHSKVQISDPSSLDVYETAFGPVRHQAWLPDVRFWPWVNGLTEPTRHLLLLPDEELCVWRGMHGHGSRRGRRPSAGSAPPCCGVRMFIRQRVDIDIYPKSTFQRFNEALEANFHQFELPQLSNTINFSSIDVVSATSTDREVEAVN